MIHLIHNSERLERKESFTREFAEQGISLGDVNIWDAIFGHHPFTNIAKAHKQIIQYAKDNNLPDVTILEDDVKFTSPRAFNYFIENKPEDFDIYLGGLQIGLVEDGKTNDFAGLHCYIMHERFYDTFLSMPEAMDIDRNLKGRGIFKVCTPMVCTQQTGFWSDNIRGIVHYTSLYGGYEFHKG